MHTELVRNEFGGKKINILELGSGNSKFLINLYRHGLLKNGWGIEVSESRFKFASKWTKDLSIENITNINCDILNFDFRVVNNLDLCFCVDLCFQFLEPIKKDSECFVLEKIYQKLKPGGKIILELDYCGQIICNLPLTSKIWQEFPETDPWKYSLWDCEFDQETKILNWKKTFISRKNEFDYSSVFLKIYTADDISLLLNKVGFNNIRLYKDWNYSKFEDDSGEFVIIAEK
jgi:SAM-dependent methyltransferase